MLAPEKLSRNSRGQADTIGAYGENTAAYVHGLSQQQREKLNSRLRKYSGFISELNTKKQGKGLGWIEMSASEKFISNHTNIKAMHLSDGILRIIAIAALAEIKKNTGIVLLEEIENGINPHIAEILTRDIREISDTNRRQVVLTTHNPVLLDFFSEESIVFLWRNKNGMVNSSDMFANEKVREYLEYMYPGEVWLNMGGNELIENLQREN